MTRATQNLALDAHEALPLPGPLALLMTSDPHCHWISTTSRTSYPVNLTAIRAISKPA